ncbi:MAG TPA: YncE family protein [Ktedonosporobacter sp.]|nr:YncE family protein [Ktedonosporobacter sp.]
MTVQKQQIKLPIITLLYLCAPLFLTQLAFSAPAHAAASSFPILGVLHAGNHPEALAVDTQTHMLYIAYESPGLIVGFDPISGKVRWHTPLGNTATDVQADSSNQRVYAVTSGNNGNTGGNLFLLDGATGHILTTLPIGSSENKLAFDAGRHIIYTADQDDGFINVFTFTSGWQSAPPVIQRTHLHAGSHPQALAVNSRLGRLYVADGATNFVTAIDEQNGSTLAIIPVGEFPVPPMRVDEATGRIYVVCAIGQELDVIDGNTNSVIAHTPTTPYPEGVASNSATGRIYVTDEGDREGHPGRPAVGSTITVIDGHSFANLGTLEVGRSPDGAEADPALHIVYIALEDNGAVLELSDSLDLPLKYDQSGQQAIAARQSSELLQQATIVTLILMTITLVAATLHVLLPHWRGRGSPRTQPADASSHPESHSPPQ